MSRAVTQRLCPCHGHQTRWHCPTFSCSYCRWLLGWASCLWQNSFGKIGLQDTKCYTIQKCHGSLSEELHYCFLSCSTTFYPIQNHHKVRDEIYKKENADRSTFPQMGCNLSHPWHNCHLLLNWVKKQYMLVCGRGMCCTTLGISKDPLCSKLLHSY